MKKITIILTLLITILINKNAAAQTNVSGGIHSNTTWTLANSPYHLTASVVVFPGNKLTIEPGVKVIFDGSFDLEIRGELVANGTSSNNINFCGKQIIVGTDTSYVLWNRIYIEQSNNGKCSFAHCVLKDGTTAIENLKSQNTVTDCIFEYNVTGISGLSAPAIENCMFRYNKSGIKFSGNMEFNNCKFYYNDEALYVAWGSNISNCDFAHNRNGINICRGNINSSTFKYNVTAIKGTNFDGANQGYRKDTIRGCTIQYNDYGIDDSAYSSGGNIVIADNDISLNRIGVKLNYCGRLTGTYNPIIKNNKLCQNTDYNAVNANNIDKNFTDNCFCTDDSAEIESKLYDGYDDISLGLLTYNIYGNDCNQKQLNVFKKLPVDTKDTGCKTFKGCASYTSGVALQHYKLATHKTMPNPFSDVLTIETKLALPSTIYITDMQGKTIYTYNTDGSTGKIEIATGTWTSGLYLLVISNSSGISSSKIIKQ